MLGKLNIHMCIVILFLSILQKENHSYQDNDNNIEHKVVLHHPGEKTPVKALLTQVKDKTGFTTEYFMDVESVICLENVCKIIPVRLYWNEIGEYQRYTLEQGATLEKYEADVFATEDYKKLHTILQNKNSPFKEVYIEDILTVKNEIADNVDAISGATALELDPEDTVPGAALTCFTLWHWANGEITPIIKQLTATTATNKQLIVFINTKSTTHYTLALEQLTQRNLYQKKYLEAIFKTLKSKKRPTKPTINYLETATEKDYLKYIKKLFYQGNVEQKIAALKSIAKTDSPTTPLYLDRISSYANTLQSYQEVVALLNMLEDKKHFSEQTANNLIPLLNADFLTARRVYWFLSNKKLTNTQNQKVIMFKNLYKNKI